LQIAEKRQFWQGIFCHQNWARVKDDTFGYCGIILVT